MKLSVGDWIVVVVTGLYFAAAVAYAIQKKWPAAVVYLGYAFANVGLIWGLRS